MVHRVTTRAQVENRVQKRLACIGIPRLVAFAYQNLYCFHELTI